MSSNKAAQKKQPSLKKSLSIATAIMVGSVFLSRITGLIREMVLAQYGGTSYEMDAYVTSFLIPEILNHFLAGGFLSITFIPIFQKFLTRGDNKGAWNTFSNLFTTGSILFLIFIPVAMFFTPNLLSFLNSNASDPATAELTIRLTRIILPAQMFFYWGAFLMAVQYANHKYFLPALSPLCYNLGIILCGYFLRPYIGIEGFAWGVLIGSLVGNVFLQLPGAMRVGLKFKPQVKPLDPEFINYVKKTIPLVLGLGMAFSNEIFFRFFSAFLDEGAASSVNYALRTMMFIVAIFGQASGVAFYPYLSKMAAEKAYKKMADLLNNMLTGIAIYLIPLSALMAVLSAEIVSILFERGSFTAQSTSQVASVFSVYLTGAFAYSASFIISRSFYALQNTILPMVVSTVIAISSIPLYILFSSSLGAEGIALASASAMVLQFLTLYFLWCRSFGGYRSLIEWFSKLSRILFASAIGAALCVFLRRLAIEIFPEHNKLIYNIVIGATSSLPSMIVIFILYELMGLQKLRSSFMGLLERKRSPQTS
ncbi:integral membrane protein MviN [Chitinispirillum alkaliphilum]|nr:integral membrane protein MviN [Chitinispirillum alkaliphilum]